MIRSASEMKSALPGCPRGADPLFRNRLPLKQAELGFQLPGVAGAQELGEIARAALGVDFLESGR